MRHIVLTILTTVALPATAEAPEMQYRYGCFDDKLVIQIGVKADKPTVFQIVLPADVCGPSI